MTNSSKAQNSPTVAPFECESRMTPELFKAYQEDLRNFDADRINQLRGSTIKVPVRFTLFRKSDGTTDFSPEINLSTYQDAIDNLNEEYNDLNDAAIPGVIFEMCGDPIFVDSDYFYDLIPTIIDTEEKEALIYELSYASSDANVYSYYSGSPSGSGGAASHPCNSANSNAICPEETIDNVLFMGGRNSYLLSTIVHEFGHHFGLLHTHGTTDIYNFPAVPGQVDHPETGGLNARELVIREEDETAEYFQKPNCDNAGDFCCDTPATGITNVGVFWPAAGQQGPFADPGITPIFFTCNVEGTYVDYNQHSIFDNPDFEEGNKNFMGYGACQDHFTNDQTDRIMFYYDNRRKDQYELALCGNFNDVVNYWDLPEIMNEISIQTSHNGTYKRANTFTEKDGSFSSILYATGLEANVRKVGANGFDNYSWDDWTEELSTLDLITLAHWLIGLEPLTGYQILAGDVNKDNQISAFDLIEIQRLILGIDQEFSNHPAPWRFIPEYIPTNYPDDFHDLSPFQMTIDGISTNGIASYIEPTWEYQIADGNSGTNGFHGYKLGDIDGSSRESGAPECHQCEIAMAADPLLLAGQAYDIGLTVDQSATVSGLQLTLSIDPVVQITKVVANLPGYSELEHSNIVTRNTGDELRLLWFDTNGSSVSKLDRQITISVTLTQDSYLSALFNPQTTGNLLISDISNCEDISVLNMELIPAATDRDGALEAYSATDDWLVYPNPSTTTIHIKAPVTSNLEGVDLAMYNTLGQLVLVRNGFQPNEVFTIDVSSFPRGTYFLKTSNFAKAIFIE